MVINLRAFKRSCFGIYKTAAFDVICIVLAISLIFIDIEKNANKFKILNINDSHIKNKFNLNDIGGYQMILMVYTDGSGTDSR